MLSGDVLRAANTWEPNLIPVKRKSVKRRGSKLRREESKLLTVHLVTCWTPAGLSSRVPKRTIGPFTVKWLATALNNFEQQQQLNKISFVKSNKHLGNVTKASYLIVRS